MNFTFSDAWLVLRRCNELHGEDWTGVVIAFAPFGITSSLHLMQSIPVEAA